MRLRVLSRFSAGSQRFLSSVSPAHPFLIPGHTQGKRVDARVRSVDLLPTLLDALGVNLPAAAELDGSSLMGLIEGRPDGARTAYSESINDLSAYAPAPISGFSLYSVQDERWKLIAYRRDGAFKQLQLFDLASEPRETINLWGREARHGRRLLHHLEGHGAIVDDVKMPELDEKTREGLRSLGYSISALTE